MRGLVEEVRPLLLSCGPDETSRRAGREWYLRLRNATPEAMRACSEATQHTQLEGGVALSPADAATCFLDVHRTWAMLRGSFNAIREAMARFSGRPIEVVYAGTGPLAPFALLLMPLLDPQRVRFTMIDIAPASADSVSSLLYHYGFEEFVRAVVCGDATRYRHPCPIDVLISETMQRSLAREPFVSILRNLRPQLSSGGFVVPERVTIDFGFLDAEGEKARWAGSSAAPAVDVLATVFGVSADSEKPSPGSKVRITASRRQGGTKWAALQTRIDVFGGETLKPYESGLTMPEILWPLSPLDRDVTLEFHYATGINPGIQWREIR